MKILVLDGPSYGRAIEGLGHIICDEREFIKDPGSFDLVLFTGGEDVSPELYGDTSPEHYCHNNIYRDMKEIRIFKIAQQHEVRMTGICRGSQFLNVMCGGRMIHDVNNHGHSAGHLMYTNRFPEPIKVNTLHHQMSVLGKGGLLIGWAEGVSGRYLGWADKPEEWVGGETEAFIYPEHNVCGVQYHPEMMPPNTDGFKFYHRLIEEFLDLSMDDLIKLYGARTKIANAE